MSANDYPIVFVHGFLGWGPDEAGFGHYWKGVQKVPMEVLDGRTVAFASVGPLSSQWDRARELFYRIRGGEVDYGTHPAHYGDEPDHLDKLGIQPDGTRVEGWPHHEKPLFADWGPDRPIHLVGHSQGASTIRVLQHMLSEGLFDNEPAGDSWIRSVTTISGVNNGTTMAYANGAAEPDGRLRRKGGIELLAHLVKLSLETSFDLLRRPLLLSEILSALPHVAAEYNWDLEQWGLTRRSGWDLRWPPWPEPLADFLLRVLRHDFLYGKDCAPYDLSVHSMAQWNRVLRESAETFYFAFVTQSTEADSHGHHTGGRDMLPLLRSLGREMGRFSETLEGVSGFQPEAWWPNDGAVPCVSQVEPWLGRPGVAEGGEAARDEYRHNWDGDWPDGEIEPGIWHVMKDPLRGWDHLDIVVFPDRAAEFPGKEGKLEGQVKFYTRLMEGLWDLPPR